MSLQIWAAVGFLETTLGLLLLLVKIENALDERHERKVKESERISHAKKGIRNWIRNWIRCARIPRNLGQHRCQPAYQAL